MPKRTREEQREYQRIWIAKRRDEWINSQGGACKTCGSTDGLEVDHIDRTTKTMQPSWVWSRRADVREAELVKCQVLCRDCHKDKTTAELTRDDRQHGDYMTYQHGCRCSECTKSQLSRVYEWRRARRVLTRAI